MLRMSLVLSLFLCLSFGATAQTAQVGANPMAAIGSRLKVEHVAYRQARWDATQIKESEPDFPNQGGQVSVYFQNTTEKPMSLRFWRLNGKDESYWRLNRLVAWDRTYGEELAPGAHGVIEINGISPDFAPGKEFNFSYVDGGWLGAGGVKTALVEDTLQISYVRVLPGLQEVEVFVRNTWDGKVRFAGVEILNKTVGECTWAAPELAGVGVNIARVKLSAPLVSAEPLLVRVNFSDSGGERSVCAHRRVFADYFPIGTWGAEEDLREELDSLHIDTCVMGGSKTDSFWTTDAARYGMKAMVHTAVITEVDRIREFAGSEHLAAWMIQDEPDWKIPAQQMLLADSTVRRYDSTTPTFITLCRNTKFFEYAPIADIPCQDHYSVTAPSSSLWPTFYGTRLEETGIYTADLKAASEPKPIWIWSQGLFGWGERPRRPVPTPSELGVQLVQNLGRGAKGILWFSYRSELGEKYPDTRSAMRAWGRTMTLLREDFLASEPAAYAIEAPEKLDAKLLAGRDSAILCVTNADYEIHPEAYPFVMKENVVFNAQLPSWLSNVVSVVRLDANQIKPVTFTAIPGGIRIEDTKLLDAAVYLITPKAAREDELQRGWSDLVAKEG